MKISRSRIIAGLASVLVIVIGVGWYFGVYEPLANRIASAQGQVGLDQTQLANDRVQLAQLVHDKRNASKLGVELKALQSTLPAKFSLATFISQADAVAGSTGVPLLQISPTQPGSVATTAGSSATVPGVSAIPFTAEATGTFVALMHFLHGMDHLTELVNFQTMQLSALSGGGANPKINLSFTGSVYYRS
jgi:Tfp pilus assembly protein PilO